MDKINKLKNERIAAQLKAFGIFEQTKDMTEEQVNESIYKRITSLNRKEAMELESNEELRMASCGINIDILEVILQNVEKLETEQYKTLNEIKKAAIDIVNASKISEVRHYVGWSEDEKNNICDKEVNQFVSFINNINDNDVRDVPPLFYRRVLSEVEEGEILRKLQNKWLNKIKPCYNISTNEILSFNTNDFVAEVDWEIIIELLMSHGDVRIYEINSCEVDAVSYIMDTNALYRTQKLQTYWCSNKMDWAIIKDHEGFIFICGELLINACSNGGIFKTDN